MAKNGMYHLGLVEALLTLNYILRANTTLGEIDVTYRQSQQKFLALAYLPSFEQGKELVLSPYIPFSLSTLSTTTTSFRPTRISFWILLIRLLDSSLNKIIPSMLSYSSNLTYAPISAIYRQQSERSASCLSQSLPEELGEIRNASSSASDGKRP